MTTRKPRRSKTVQIEKEIKQKEYMIPFSERKAKLLSISFRSTEIELGRYKLKIQPSSPNNDLNNFPLFSSLSETTMVSLKIKYNKTKKLFLY